MCSLLFMCSWKFANIKGLNNFTNYTQWFDWESNHCAKGLTYQKWGWWTKSSWKLIPPQSLSEGSLASLPQEGFQEVCTQHRGKSAVTIHWHFVSGGWGRRLWLTKPVLGHSGYWGPCFPRSHWETASSWDELVICLSVGSQSLPQGSSRQAHSYLKD